MNKLNEIVVASNLEPVESNNILERFGAYEAIAKEWEAKAKMIVVTSADQKTEMAMAKEARKKFSDMRIEIEKTRKSMKEQSLRKGQAIDAVARFLTSLVEPIEKYLKEQEDFVKIQEEKRLAEIKAEEEKKAEAERLLEEQKRIEEQEKLKVENERLRKEALEKEALLKKQQQEQEAKLAEQRRKADEERKLIEEKARLEKEALEKQLKQAKKVSRYQIKDELSLGNISIVAKSIHDAIEAPLSSFQDEGERVEIVRCLIEDFIKEVLNETTN